MRGIVTIEYTRIISVCFQVLICVLIATICSMASGCDPLGVSSPVPLRHRPGLHPPVPHRPPHHGHHLLVALGLHQLALDRFCWGDGGGGCGGDGDRDSGDGGGGGGDGDKGDGGGGGGGGDGDRTGTCTVQPSMAADLFGMTPQTWRD